MLRLTLVIILLVVAAHALPSCKREERTFRVEPPYVMSVEKIPVTRFGAGGPTTMPVAYNEYEENAYAMAEGKRLFMAMNCVGCHANGGGGMGPPLIDDKWIYGSEPEQVFATIVQGRPNGMPSFARKIPDYQVWQIAAYVRSMSGLTRADARPARADHMKSKPPESDMDPKTPVQGGTPAPASEMPQ